MTESPIRYWHGLRRHPNPAAVRWIETAEMLDLPIREGAPPEWREYVHASTSREVALAFGVCSGGRALIEVDPGSLPVEDDPDFPTLSVRFHGPVRAVSVEVFDDSALPSARRIVKALAADYRWTDGTPQYWPDGYLRTPPASRSRGFVDEDFRWLGRWWPFHFLYPHPEGFETAVDEHGRPHLMFPPGFPGLGGRRRVPRGSLDGAWNRPAFFPNPVEFQRLLQIRSTASDRGVQVRMPWEW